MTDNIVLPSTGEVSRYLRNNGWTNSASPSDKLLYFTSSQKDDAGGDISLLLPNGPGFSDGDKKLVSAIELPAAMTNLTFEKMVYAIKHQASDIFDQRIFGPPNLSSIPLEFMPSIMQHLRNLVYYSACLEDDALPYFERGRKIGKEYTEKCRFAHTFRGSFGLRIEMPLPPNSHDTLPLEGDGITLEPIERRIMKRIYCGINLSVRGVNEGDVSLITNNYKTGFNANLCEAMESLTEILPDYCFGYFMNWSPEYKIPESYICKEEISVQANEYRQFFESAAKTLRATGESQQTTISGRIISLHATPDDEEDDDELSPSFSNQYIEIEWLRDEGKKTKIRASLPFDEYRSACDAHKDGKIIRLSGIPEKQGKIFVLRNPSAFQVESSEQ